MRIKKNNQYTSYTNSIKEIIFNSSVDYSARIKLNRFSTDSVSKTRYCNSLQGYHYNSGFEIFAGLGKAIESELMLICVNKEIKKAFSKSVS